MKKLMLVSVGFFVILAGCATSPHRTSIKIYLQQHNKAKVLHEAQAWVKEDPQNAEAHLWLGLAYAINQKYIEASREIEKALKLDSTFYNPEKLEKTMKSAGVTVFGLDAVVTTLKNAAVKLAKENQNERALHYLDIAIKFKANDADLYLIKASLEKRAGNENYIASLKKAYEIAPDNPKVNYHLGLALKAQNKYDEALKHFKKLLKLSPKDPNGPFNIGVIFYEMDKYDSAIVYFKKTTEIDSTKKDAWLNLGIAAVKAKDYELAYNAFKKYTQLSPDDPQGFYLLAVAVLDAQKPLQEALEAIDHAIALKPDDPDYYNLKGLIYKQMGKTKESLEMYKKAQELEKNK